MAYDINRLTKIHEEVSNMKLMDFMQMGKQLELD